MLGKLKSEFQDQYTRCSVTPGEVSTAILLPRALPPKSPIFGHYVT